MTKQTWGQAWTSTEGTLKTYLLKGLVFFLAMLLLSLVEDVLWRRKWNNIWGRQVR